MWPKYDCRRQHPHRHGRLPWKGCTRTSQRSELHFRGISHRSVSCCISWRTLQIRLNALLSNTSSILNYSQARIVGLRNTYALSLAATEVVIEMLSDPNFDSRKIHTKYVKRLKKRLLNGFDGGDVSVSTCMKKWTASRTLCCWMHFWRRGLCRFHSLYNSSRRLRNLLLIPPQDQEEVGYRGRPAPDGCEHQAYMVYNEADLVWARRLQFHLRRFQAWAE